MNFPTVKWVHSGEIFWGFMSENFNFPFDKMSFHIFSGWTNFFSIVELSLSFSLTKIENIYFVNRIFRYFRQIFSKNKKFAYSNRGSSQSGNEIFLIHQIYLGKLGENLGWTLFREKLCIKNEKEQKNLKKYSSRPMYQMTVFMTVESKKPLQNKKNKSSYAVFQTKQILKWHPVLFGGVFCDTGTSKTW